MKKTIIASLSLIVLCSTALWAPVGAQEKIDPAAVEVQEKVDPAPVESEKVVVTATRSEIDLSEAPGRSRWLTPKRSK